MALIGLDTVGTTVVGIPTRFELPVGVVVPLLVPFPAPQYTETPTTAPARIFAVTTYIVIQKYYRMIFLEFASFSGSVVETQKRSGWHSIYPVFRDRK